MKSVASLLGIPLALLVIMSARGDVETLPPSINTTGHCQYINDSIDRSGYLQFRNAMLSGLHTLHKLWWKHPASTYQSGLVTDVSVQMSSGPFHEAMTGKIFCGAIIYSSLAIGKILKEAEIPYGKEMLSGLLLLPAFYHHDYVFDYNKAGLKTLLLYGTAKSSMKVLEEALEEQHISKSEAAAVLAAGATSQWITYAIQYGEPDDFLWLAMPKIVGGAAVNMAYKDSQEQQETAWDVMTNGLRWHIAGVVIEVVSEPLTAPDFWQALIPVIGDFTATGKIVSQVASYVVTISRKVQKVVGIAAAETSKQVVEQYVDDQRLREPVQFFTLLLLSYSSAMGSQMTNIRLFNSLRRGLVSQMALFQIKWLMKEAADLIDSSFQPFYHKESLISFISGDPEVIGKKEGCTVLPVSGSATSHYALICMPPTNEAEGYDTETQFLGLLYAVTVFLIIW